MLLNLAFLYYKYDLYFLFLVKNTLIRSRIKDRTIDQLKRDLEDQYYQQDSNEEVLRLQRELEDAKEFYLFQNFPRVT